MKTADGVEFTQDMDLWTFEGEKIPRDKSKVPEPHGDTLCIEWTEEPQDWHTEEYIERGGRDKWSTLAILYASEEAAKADRESPHNECFVCGVPLELAFRKPNDDTISAIYDGLYFRATGNFGSTVFDPMIYEFLEAVICDECVVKRQHRLRHWYEPMKPDEPDKFVRMRYMGEEERREFPLTLRPDVAESLAKREKKPIP